MTALLFQSNEVDGPCYMQASSTTFQKRIGYSKLSPQSAQTGQQGYSAHRQRQKLRILVAAELLFTKSGIDRVSMLEIAAAASVRPSTLYQYFSQKEDIVWAITGEVLRDIQQRIQTQIDTSMTGLQKIAAVLDVLGKDLEGRPEKVRFMSQFDVLYAQTLPAEALLSLEREIGVDCFRDLHRWVAEGIADGSMRPELKPELTLHAVLNAAIGTQRRLAALGEKVEQEYGQRADALFREAMRIVLLGLSAGPSTKQNGKRTSSRSRSSGEKK